MPDSDVVPDGVEIINRELGKRTPWQRPKARPELKKENPVPAEKNGAPVAPDRANRPQVAFAHLPAIDH
jgi:hypothetical protein